MSVRHRAAPRGDRHGRPPLRHGAGRRPAREGNGRVGLLGLGTYGIGLSAVGVISLAGPLVAVAAGASPGVGLSDLLNRDNVAVVADGAPVLVPSRERAPAERVPEGATAATEPPPARQGEMPRRGTAFRPTRLLLPDGTTAPVLSAGLNPDGSFAVPELPSQLGWWTGGARADDPFGSMVIAGHVDSKQYGLGALYHLDNVRRGQVIEARAGTRSQRYRVTSVANVPQARLARGTSAFRQDIDHRLVLITCGGPFDRSRGHYTENVVVVATPVP